MPEHSAPNDTALHALVDELSLEQKVRLLTGADFWSTHPEPAIGLRRMVLSDGPSGVRGESWDERDPSLNLPSATALAASWDRGIAYQYGATAAAEARRKDVNVVLGPTINLQRSPLGGRHFEAFSEDPMLAADLAAAYVAGVQENGVAATPKHYIANEYETDRFTASTEVSERVLRELYLFPFEKAVTEAGAWAIMSSYNSINGVTASEHELLETPLNSEWGFDGIVVSDWTGVRSTAAAKASQDLAMPGPHGAWGPALIDAVRTGDVAETAIDRKVRRILRLAARVGNLAGLEPAVASPAPVGDGVAFAREAAAEGAVLVRNDSALPLETATISRLAVIGNNADLARTQGGGSATVLPEHVVSPLEGIRAALPHATVDYAIGAVVQEGIAQLPLSTINNPATGESGVRVTFRKDGAELFTENRFATSLVWFGGDAPIRESDTLRLDTQYVPAESGTIKLGIAGTGPSRIWVDNTLVLDVDVRPEGDDLGAAFLNPPSAGADVHVEADRPASIRVEHDLHNNGGLSGALSFGFGTLPEEADPQALIDQAVETAADADVAVVVVGTNATIESEGYDRTSLTLPGYQDDLVRAVAATNPNTVVVVNAGAPVELPWRHNVAGILLTWFGGQEYGNALADVLTGLREPGGRMPTTWPVTLADVPVINVTPDEGKVRYEEGVHIGYRAWLRSGAEPAFAFGSGLGYTTWKIGDVTAAPTVATGGSTTVTASVTNTGNRAGKQVVQVYASRAETWVDRPVRWLVGFTTVRLDAGTSTTVAIEVPARAFAHWDGTWVYEPGIFTLHVGSSVDDEAGKAAVTLH